MLTRLLIHPDIEIRKQQIDKQIQDLGFKIHDSDLLFLSEEEKLGVDAAKTIREHLATKAYQSKVKGVIVVDADKLTPEAQNSLLKTLEEPPEEAVIIFGVSSEEKLLTTVASRCEIIRLSGYTSDVSAQTSKFNADIKKLLSFSVDERFEFIEELEDKEEFLEALIQYFQGHPFSAELLQADQWLASNVNSRAVMEYLMLKLPKQ